MSHPTHEYTQLAYSLRACSLSARESYSLSGYVHLKTKINQPKISGSGAVSQNGDMMYLQGIVSMGGSVCGNTFPSININVF
jgi:hypothetical protein